MYRSAEHLAFVRARPCCYCSAPGPSDPHHFGGSGGTGIKAHDLFTVPLCRQHHDEYHQHRKIGALTRIETSALLWKECALLLSERVMRGDR